MKFLGTDGTFFLQSWKLRENLLVISKEKRSDLLYSCLK
jgi:hypothetical protein